MSFVASNSFESGRVEVDDFELCSLKSCNLMPGDILFVPACALVFEKSTKANGIGIRAVSTFMHGLAAKSLETYTKLHSSTLGSN